MSCHQGTVSSQTPWHRRCCRPWQPLAANRHAHICLGSHMPSSSPSFPFFLPLLQAFYLEIFINPWCGSREAHYTHCHWKVWGPQMLASSNDWQGTAAAVLNSSLFIHLPYFPSPALKQDIEVQGGDASFGLFLFFISLWAMPLSNILTCLIIFLPFSRSH